MGVDITSLGAWMEYGSFVLDSALGAGEGFDLGLMYNR